jgi:hypothetical protein
VSFRSRIFGAQKTVFPITATTTDITTTITTTTVGTTTNTNTTTTTTSRSRVSSGSIVSDYRLDDRAIGVRSPAGAKDFSSSVSVQTCSAAHPATCTMGTGDPFPGGKARPGRDADQSPPSSAEVENE